MRSRFESAQLLSALSKDELIKVILSFSFCAKHLEQKIGGGHYSGCLHCTSMKDSSVLGRIDYLVDTADGRENEMQLAIYDTDYYADGVFDRLKRFLEKTLGRSI